MNKGLSLSRCFPYPATTSVRAGATGLSAVPVVMTGHGSKEAIVISIVDQAEYLC